LIAPDVDVAAASASDIVAAVHAFVARTPSFLVVAQIEDLAGERTAVNLPGTDRERPNWRRRLAPQVTDVMRTPQASAIFAAIRAAGRRSSVDEDDR
jgi:4-alpha-glucanotransferase